MADCPQHVRVFSVSVLLFPDALYNWMLEQTTASISTSKAERNGNTPRMMVKHRTLVRLRRHPSHVAVPCLADAHASSQAGVLSLLVSRPSIEGFSTLGGLSMLGCKRGSTTSFAGTMERTIPRGEQAPLHRTFDVMRQRDSEKQSRHAVPVVCYPRLSWGDMTLLGPLRRGTPSTWPVQQRSACACCGCTAASEIVQAHTFRPTSFDGH